MTDQTANQNEERLWDDKPQDNQHNQASFWTLHGSAMGSWAYPPNVDNYGQSTTSAYGWDSTETFTSPEVQHQSPLSTFQRENYQASASDSSQSPDPTTATESIGWNQGVEDPGFASRGFHQPNTHDGAEYSQLPYMSHRSAPDHNVHQDLSYSYVPVTIATPALANFLDVNPAPYAPVRIPENGGSINYQTNSGINHVQELPYNGHYQPQVPATDSSSSSWAIISLPPEDSPYSDFAPGLGIPSSPSDQNIGSPPRSMNAKSSTQQIKTEEVITSPVPQPLKGDPRYKDGSSRNGGHLRERQQKTKVSKRQGKLSDEKRAKAAEMRKTGRCLRCTMYKLGCDGRTPCKRCTKVAGSARSFLEPCTRADLKDQQMVRLSNGRFQQDYAKFLNYDFVRVDKTLPTVEIHWSLPGNERIRGPLIPPLKVQYGQIVDRSDGIDKTNIYINGRTKPIQTQPFAVRNTSKLTHDMSNLIQAAQPKVEEWIEAKYKDDPLNLLTFQEACRYRDKTGSTIVTLAIRMQCGAIMSQGYGSVPEDAAAGFVPVDYGHSKYAAYNRGNDTPLPQAMGHQCDVAILNYINELQIELVKALKGKIFASGKKPWYEIFLTCFVLLSNLEYIHDDAKAYIRTKMQTALQSQVSFVVTTQIERWKLSARIVLQHFRCVLKGFVPFHIAKDRLHEVKEGAKLDDEATLYIQRALQLLNQQASHYTNLDASPTDSPDMKGRWIHQLFTQSYHHT